jgi:hypothetical protein
MRQAALAALLSFVFTSAAATATAQTTPIDIILKNGDAEHKNLVVTVPLSLPETLARVEAVPVTIINGKDPGKTIGQLTEPGVNTKRLKPATKLLVRRDLHVVLPHMPANKTWTLRVELGQEVSLLKDFAWTKTKDGLHELVLTDSQKERPILRYMNYPFDDSTKEKRDRSYKVFHHLYNPDGTRLVTNGGHADLNDGETRKLLFPHHRGIMYGFNKITYGPGFTKKADTWHCTGAAHVAHEKFVVEEAGPVLGRQRVLLNWHGEKKEVFATEERELTVYKVPGGTLVEFASILKTAGSDVKLDGDPQHAGFQFRAAQDVAAKTAKQTYYLHPEGKGELGATRNWPQDKAMVNLPWYAMSFVIDDQRYTVAYLNHPLNPKESRFSERDYGRFGGYFVYELREQNPLLVNYRLWLQEGEMTVEQGEALRAAFAAPPKVDIK